MDKYRKREERTVMPLEEKGEKTPDGEEDPIK